jgi:hypothetical protein
MHAFTNKGLRDETNDKGRNLQVMQKGRERDYLKRHEEVPLSRNEKRQLGEGSKVTEQTVARAARRGQLVSRSQVQLTKRVGKAQSELQKAVAIVQEQRASDALTSELKSPAPLIHPSNISGASDERSGVADSLGAGRSRGADIGAVGSTLPPAGRGAGGARGRAGAAGVPAGRGRGGAAGAPTERGRGVASGAGSARGCRGRGRGGRGRSRPANAQDI